MSDILEEDRPLTPAERIDAEAAAWFVEANEPADWMEESRAAFKGWLAESPKHLLAYWRAEAAWEHAGLLEAVRPVRDLRGKEAPPERHGPDWKFWLGGFAAIAAVLVVGFVAMSEFAGGPTITWFTPVGGTRTIAFADGSRIELNTDTVVETDSAVRPREIALVRGEAFFDVKHDPSHPLVVTVGPERLVDLGTSFVVRKDSGQTKIGLVEGSLRLEAAGFWQPQALATLAPGDLAVTTGDRVLIEKDDAAGLADALAWREGRLVFRHAMLATAAAEFNRYNREKLVVADADVGALRFSSVFPVHGIEAFVRLAEKSLGLHVVRRDGEIVIGR